MSTNKKSSIEKWYERWEENIKGKPREKADISREEWDKLSPKEKVIFIRKRRARIKDFKGPV